MKIAILAAGKSDYFPLFIDKPKCLYHLDGMVQLERVINDCASVVGEENLIVVAGYKWKHIAKYLKRHPKVTLKINNNYKKSAIYSYREAANGENEDIVFICADESIKIDNIKKICNSDKKMSILYHNSYYYYSVGIFKLKKSELYRLFDDKYLDMIAMKEIYCFANNKKTYDGKFSINSGICLGYIVIDLVRQIGNIDKIINPSDYIDQIDVDCIFYDPSIDYKKDLDDISDTDEYKNNVLLRFYSTCISFPLRMFWRLCKKICKKKN